MTNSRQYELVYILSPYTAEQQVSELQEQVSGIVSRFGGQLVKSENWGRRKLAYEIAHFREGIYLFEVIDGHGDAMKEIDRRLKVTDFVIRHAFIRVDEELRVAERVRSRRRADAERPGRRQPAAAEPAEETQDAAADEGVADEVDVEGQDKASEQAEDKEEAEA
jgi:small subunit ribosomal protein S6